jgi:hypothetical protein
VGGDIASLLNDEGNGVRGQEVEPHPRLVRLPNFFERLSPTSL